MRLSMKWTRGLLIAGLLGLATPAKAGILLDPYLSYEMGNFDTTYTAGGSLKYDTSGVGFGARVGYTLPLVFFALDYSMSSGKAKVKEDAYSAMPDNDFDRSTLYALVGVKLPFIRGWAGYGFINDVKMKATATTTESTLKGSAIKVGVGYTGLPIVSLNAEYIMSNFTKLKTDTGDEDISGPTFKDSKNNTILLSISAPFDL